MQSLRCALTKTPRLALVCAVSFVAGCGNSCFVGFSVNGNGGIIVKAGDPPPVCQLNQAQGNVRVVMVEAPSCEQCAPVAQVRHMFVELRGFQLHNAGEDAETAWVDVAPELAANPRQFDLIGGSQVALTASPAMVPAGTYDLVRLQFAPQFLPVESDASSDKTPCGATATNCLILGDGRTLDLGFAGQRRELVLKFAQDRTPFFLLPDARAELRIQLGAQQSSEIAVSGAPPLRIVGDVAVQREVSPD